MGIIRSKETSLAFFWSQPFLTSKPILWALFWTNLLGTAYGYEWYWQQLVYTAQEKSPLLLPFVPDSPTASLFFTLALAFLIFDRFRGGQRTGRFAWLRGLIEALAVITSVKYGIWAVAMIIDGAIQGTPLVWEHWMLMVSHSSMALEALLYARFFRMKWMNIAIAAAWTLLNDFIDYGLGVFPWLPDVLLDDLGPIQIFTTTLSLFGIGCAVASKQIPDRNQV